MEFKMPQLPAGAKPFCLGAVAGAVLLGWAGFDALGWKLNSAAEALANKKAEAAVVTASAMPSGCPIGPTSSTALCSPGPSDECPPRAWSMPCVKPTGSCARAASWWTCGRPRSIAASVSARAVAGASSG